MSALKLSGGQGGNLGIDKRVEFSDATDGGWSVLRGVCHMVKIDPVTVPPLNDSRL